MERKLGVNATQRLALIKNQASALLWNGKIETTVARAKEVSAYVKVNYRPEGEVLSIEKKVTKHHQ